jgi:hypothetical protein
MMFPIVLPLPRTSISLGTGFECFFAHPGSASIASGLRLGTFPSKVTVPFTVDAASATPGHIAAPASPAARHTIFAVLRILVSFVIVHPPLSSTDAAAAHNDRTVAAGIRARAKLYTRPV